MSPQQGMEEQQRAVAVLKIFLTYVEYIGISFLIWYLIVAKGVNPAYTFITVVAVVVSFGLHNLLKRGHFHLVAWTLTGSLLVLVTLSLFAFGSMRDVGLTAYLLVLTLTAVVLGEGAILISSSVIGVVVIALSILELNGLIQPERVALVPFDPVMFIAVLSLTVILLRAAVREINTGFKRAREQAEKLDTLNTELEYRVRERTVQLENANLQLQATKDRLEYLLSTSPVVIYSARAGGEIGTTYVSKNIQAHFGYTPDEFLSEPGFWLTHIHPDDLTRIVPRFQDILEERTRLFEYRFLHRDGRYRWVRDEAKLVGENENHPLEIIGTWVDITAQRQAEFALMENKHLLQNILDNTSTFVIAKDYRNSSGSYIFVNEAFAQQFGKSPIAFKQTTVFDIYPEEIARRLQEDDLEVFRTGIATRSEEHVLFGNRPHIVLSNKFPLFDAEGVSYGMCIVATDITELKHKEEELRSSEARFRAFIDHATDAFFLQGEKAVILDINRQACESLGYSRDELLGSTPILFDHDISSSFAEQIQANICNGEMLTFDTHYTRKDGSSYPVEVKLRAFWIDDQPFLVSLARDITERKRIEDELRRKQEAERQFSQKLSDLQEVTNILSRAETFDDLTRLAVELARGRLGFERAGLWLLDESFEVKLGTFGIDEEGKLRDEREIRRELEEGPVLDFLKQGKANAQMIGQPSFNHLGEQVGEGETVMATLWDGRETIGLITVDNYFTQQPFHETQIELLRLYATTLGHLLKRKRIEDALRKSQTNLELALEAGNVGLWSWDFGTNQIYFSPEWKAQIGYTDEEIPNSFEVWRSLLHPDDLLSVLQMLDAARQFPWPRYQVEFRMRHKKNAYRWILSQGSIEVDERGIPQRIYGSHVDISHSKQASEALLQSEARLALVFNNTSDLQMLLEVDENKVVRVAAVNQRFLDTAHMMGLKDDQNYLIGRTSLEILAQQVQGPLFLEAEYQHFREAITTKKQLTYEVHFIFAKGEFFGEVVLVPVLDEHEQCKHLLWSARDITERKRVEDTLKLTNLTIDQIPDAVYWMDDQLKIINVNFKACEMLGYTRAELMEMSAYDVEPTLLPNAPSNYLIVRSAMEKLVYESHHRAKDGTLIPVEIVVSDLEVGHQRLNCVLARDITLRKQAEQELRLSLVEKEILLKEIHHRVKNNLQVISSLLYLQSQKIKDENQLELFRESQNRVAAMALVHEQLYQSNDFAEVDFGKYVRTLVQTLFDSYGVDEHRITYIIETDGTTLNINIAIPCGLMVSEMVSNALKYAFRAKPTGQITITLHKHEAMYHLWVKDNGVGIADGLQLRPGSLGLRLIEQLTTQIGGKITRMGPPGTTYLVEFPI